MNKEEITYKIPNNQIHISEIKDEDCLIWISPKALNMANTIDELQHENQKYKEVIFKIKMIISARIKEYQKKIDNEIDMGSQGDHFKICRYEENIKFLKDILKEVK